jgi:hypothetical protein
MVMSSEKHSAPPKTPRSGDKRRKPVWAENLKRMYDDVVDEHLPDDFLDLLKKLDDAGDKQ